MIPGWVAHTDRRGYTNTVTGESYRFDDLGRMIAATFGVPDHLLGLPTSRWRRWWQRHVTRRP